MGLDDRFQNYAGGTDRRSRGGAEMSDRMGLVLWCPRLEARVVRVGLPLNDGVVSRLVLGL